MSAKQLIAVSLILVVTGCATSKANYTPPAANSVANQVTVDDDFDTVWDRLVKRLASDFFVINNIEKSSRLINLSFSSNSPTDFVTCGLTTREFTNVQGKQTIDYDPASSAQYVVADNMGRAFNVIRTTRLNGRTNVYVAPQASSTVVSVDTKYVLDIAQSFTNAYGHPAGSRDDSLDFSTKQPLLANKGFTCMANGNLEKKILDYAR